jgi:hypothetical protein
MWSFAARDPFTSRLGFREDPRDVERFEGRRLRVPPDRRFKRFEPLRLRRGAPPLSEPK